MALATLHLAAIPVVAGLLAGTGAVAAYMTGAEPQVATASAMLAAPERPCETQTWPYLDRKCMPAGAARQDNVRLVVAPRASEIDKVNPAAPTLTTRETVLRMPDRIEPKQAAPAARATAPRARAKPRRERPMIVVRPLRLDVFR